MNLVPTVQLFPLFVIKKTSDNIVTTNNTNSIIQYPNNARKAMHPIRLHVPVGPILSPRDALLQEKKRGSLASVPASFVFPTNL
jgi:hypothetical protein